MQISNKLNYSIVKAQIDIMNFDFTLICQAEVVTIVKYLIMLSANYYAKKQRENLKIYLLISLFPSRNPMESKEVEKLRLTKKNSRIIAIFFPSSPPSDALKGFHFCSFNHTRGIFSSGFNHKIKGAFWS